MRLAPRTLSGRLVTTAVALVAIVGILVCVTTQLAMRHYLTQKLDDDVRGTVGRSIEQISRGFAPPPSNDSFGRRTPGQGPGTLSAYFLGSARSGFAITEKGGSKQLSSSALRTLAAVQADNNVHHVNLPALGSYRVVATTIPSNAGTLKVVTGLPTLSMDQALSSLLWWQLLLTLCGVGAAALLGNVLVRRTLRPLRQVAAAAHDVTEEELSSGAGEIQTRVPPGLTDPQTEVGQVGSALNTLLDHVESALDARHRSEQQVRQFVADASHELRTPLSTIHGYAELSRRTPDDAAALSHALGKVETEAQRMHGLVEDLLLLARLDAGRPLESAEVDLTRLLIEDVADARVVGPDHTWRLDLPDEPVFVPGDEQRLHQLLTNLLRNATRHTPAGTTVTVALKSLEHTDGAGGVRLVVHDDGPGLPLDLVDTAFERFSRGDSSRTRASGGAGLGLSLVSAIAAAHRGAASVDSTPGDTSFSVTLPAATAGPLSAGPAVDSQPVTERR